MVFIMPSTLVRLAGVLLVLALLGGCATPAYNPISDPDFKGPPLEQVRANPEAYVDRRVRWGGSIAGVENRRDETWVEVVEYPLSAQGRPRTSTDSGGRFIARVPGFLDPAIYARDRLITVIGTLESDIERTIGDYPYRFPVVAVDQYRLWRERPEAIYYPYDPFYDPFYDRFWRRRHFYPYHPWYW